MSVGSDLLGARGRRAGTWTRSAGMPARSLRLLVGLWVFATGLALMVRADLGLSSWDVLHDAVDRLTALSFGQGVIAVSVAVVIGSLVLGVRPGPGSVANVVLVGVFTDLILGSDLLSELGSSSIALRVVGLSAGVVVIALGTALYIGAELGAGPRDGLMLAVARRLGTSPGTARAGIEGSVLLIGTLLGGGLGIGTLVFTILIGPAINYSFRLLHMTTPAKDEAPELTTRPEP